MFQYLKTKTPSIRGERGGALHQKNCDTNCSDAAAGVVWCISSCTFTTQFGTGSKSRCRFSATPAYLHIVLSQELHRTQERL